MPPLALKVYRTFYTPKYSLVAQYPSHCWAPELDESTNRVRSELSPPSGDGSVLQEGGGAKLFSGSSFGSNKSFFSLSKLILMDQKIQTPLSYIQFRGHRPYSRSPAQWHRGRPCRTSVQQRPRGHNNSKQPGQQQGRRRQFPCPHAPVQVILCDDISIRRSRARLER